jgi:murein DD-endopeptidase MepM/ murein hydrolase activator NlpD
VNEVEPVRKPSSYPALRADLPRKGGGLVLALFLLCAAPAVADDIELRGHFVQGGLVTGRATPGSRVTFEGRAMRVAADGTFLIGFGREAPPQARLVVQLPDGRTETRTLAVLSRSYDIQRIDGLPERQVSPAPEDLVRIREDQALVAQARARDTAEPFFQWGFVWPAIGPISGVYGSQRILNGEPRQPHYGVDVAAPVGTPIVAAAPGIVSLAHPDMFFTGKTVAIDHGHGLNSVYSHLATIAVADGEQVAQGQVIGTLGGTGRVTAPHLDWRVNLFDIRLDPALLVPPMPEARNR